MNQILICKNFINYKNNKKYNKYKLFIIIFIVSISLLSILVFFSFYFFSYKQQDYYNFSSLSDTVKIQTIYSKNTSYSTNNYPIIGKIKIEKINICYPIFSYISDDLLKLGICKIFGPNLNYNGNLCLAGHNYDNNSLFSNLSTLNIDDKIIIYDNNNKFIEYKIYDIFEVKDSDTSILRQNIYTKELTLITCNNFTKNRIIVKAKEIE